jgi:hypothetical protein
MPVNRNFAACQLAGLTGASLLVSLVAGEEIEKYRITRKNQLEGSCALSLFFGGQEAP